MAFIHGPGGYGKTELAKKLARSLIREQNINVLFLYGESKEKLEQSIFPLWEKMRGKPLPQNTPAVDCITSCLSLLCGRILIIIDNVDRRNKLLDEIIANLLNFKKESPCFVIVTTRDRNVVTRNYVGDLNILLEVFPREVSIQMVKQALPKETDSQIARLCEEMEDWPLALSQAISHISTFRLSSLVGLAYNISSYLQDLKPEPNTVIDRKLLSKREYKLSSGLEVSLKQIKSESCGELALKLLNMISYLDPERLHLDMLTKFYQTIFEKCITDKRISTAISNRLLELSFFQLAYKFSKENLVAFEKRMNSINSLETLKLEHNMARSLNYIGKHDESKSAFEILLEKFENQCHPDASQLKLLANFEFASLCLNLNNTDGAMQKYKEAYIFSSQSYGVKHPLTVKANQGIGICCMKIGKCQEALEKFEDVLSKRKSTCGKEDPCYIRTLCYLGECYYKLNNFEKSKDHFLDALKTFAAYPTCFHSSHMSVSITIKFLLKMLKNHAVPKMKIILSTAVGGSLKYPYLIQVMRNYAQALDPTIETVTLLHMLQVEKLLVEELAMDTDRLEEINQEIQQLTEIEKRKNSDAFGD